MRPFLDFADALVLSSAERNEMKILSAAEVAERLGVSHSAVRQWCNQGRFPSATRIGREWAILDTDLPGFQKPKRGRPKRNVTVKLMITGQAEEEQMLADIAANRYVLVQAKRSGGAKKMAQVYRFIKADG